MSMGWHMLNAAPGFFGTANTFRLIYSLFSDFLFDPTARR
jgi:hypothetical protein